MKLSQSWVLTSVTFMSFSLGLMACGSSGSSSNPGTAGIAGGSTNDIPATCQNAALLDTGNNTVSEQRDIPNADYSLSHLSLYVYNPGTGDSFAASADAQDGFRASIDCNGTVVEGRHTESGSAPDQLDSSRKLGPNDQDRQITVEFNNKQAQATSSLVADRSGTFLLDQLGRGRELTGSDRFETYQFFLTQNGGFKVLRTTELPVDPSTGKRKLVFLAAEYQPQRQIQPGPAPQPGRPGPQPGGPGHR